MAGLPALAFLSNVRRPTLRVQLTLLYWGLFVAILIVVLFATDRLYSHTEARAPQGAAPGPPASGQSFDPGPAVIGLVAAILALAGAWWLAGRFLRPLHAITTTAREISATNLNRRLALTGPSDELTELGATLDDLFGRLEASFEAQRLFVANAAHELRTPLAGQRTLLQVALADPDADTASLRAACEQVLQLGTQQEQLIDALLTLATTERGVEHWEPLDLAPIAAKVLACREEDAASRGIHVDANLAAAPIDGDSVLVQLLTANLVDNALRYNTDGGRIEVSTVAAPGRSMITIANTGPTVSSDEVYRLFDPFHRVGRDRVRHTTGHGLGLAIVQAIARTHGATITPSPRAGGGLDISVSFPPARPDSETIVSIARSVD